MKQPQRDDASSIGRKIDELLRSSPVQATYNFTAETLARVRHADMEEDLERMVDDLIAHRPVEASAGFTARTIARVRREIEPEKVPVEVPLSVFRAYGYRRAFPWVALAAVVTLAAFLGIHLFPGAPSGPRDSVPMVAEMRPVTASGNTEETADFEMDAIELFLLADALSDAEFFLDEAAGETITFLAVATQ